VVLVLGATQEVHGSAELIGASTHDAGSEIERVLPRPPAAQGQGALELSTDVDRLRRFLNFQHRRLARNLDGLFDRADCHRDVHLDVQLGADLQALALEPGEAGQHCDDVVHPGWKIEEPVETL
jgi:hypothetical protein